MCAFFGGEHRLYQILSVAHNLKRVKNHCPSVKRRSNTTYTFYIPCSFLTALCLPRFMSGWRLCSSHTQIPHAGTCQTAFRSEKNFDHCCCIYNSKNKSIPLDSDSWLEGRCSVNMFIHTSFDIELFSVVTKGSCKNKMFYS